MPSEEGRRPKGRHKGRRHRLLGLGLAAGLALASPFVEPAAAQELKDLARQAKPSVVLLEMFDRFGNQVGAGSGFFVTGDGWVVTNHHVIAGAASAQVLLDNRDSLPVTGILAKDPDNDLAVLQVDGLGQRALPLAPTSLDLEIGEPILVLGGPQGLASSLSQGILSAVRLPGDPALDALPQSALLQITAATSPGSSGSPVINLRGEAIGVVVSQMVRGQNLNFAVPIEALHDLLASIDPQRTPDPLGRFQVGNNGFLGNAAASLVFFALAVWGYRRLMR